MLAFDSSDYATTAQGTLADSATQPGDALSSLDTTVTGSELNGLKTKLDGIESGATADQTGAEIKSAYESEDDTNAFTDADHTKLDGIESAADVTDTTNVVAALTAGSNITIAGDGTISSTDTNDNTQLSDEEVQDIVGGMVTSNTESGITVTYQDADGTLDFAVASQTDENFTTADHSKLDGIESGATADQTGAEIKSLYEGDSDTNAFTDADHTKLDGIETGADVTDATNVTAAGALMDSEVTNLAQVKAFDSSDYAAALGADDNYVTDAEKVVIGNTSGTNTGDQDLSAYQLQPSEGAFANGDKTKLDAIESGATADQTASEIRTLVGSATDSNVFTDADHTKLDGISASADVTPAWVPSSDPSYATESYVDTEVSNLVDSAPGTLDTLNELAAALGDDANFSTTVTNSIAAKLPLAGGTMTGDIDMDQNEITDVNFFEIKHGANSIASNIIYSGESAFH